MSMLGGYDDGGNYNPFLGGVPPIARAGTFQEQYRCYSVAIMRGEERKNVNYGGKIILPPSALARLSMLHIAYPMQFSIQSSANEIRTHAGVLEFIAEEGRCHVPHWIMRQLALNEGDLVKIKSVTLAKGRFVKIQAQSTEFLDIYDPKAVLENTLRNFSTLTEGDIITIHYNNKLYDIKLVDVKPEKAVSIVETDLEVDFEAPVGYEEQQKSQLQAVENAKASVKEKLSKLKLSKSLMDSGVLSQCSSNVSTSGQRLDGRSVKAASDTGSELGSRHRVGDLVDAATLKDAPLRLPLGHLFFGYPVVPLDQEEEGQHKDDDGAFQGEGKRLRAARKGKGRML